METTVFRSVKSCNTVLTFQKVMQSPSSAIMMAATETLKMSIHFYSTVWCNLKRDKCLPSQGCVNIQSQYTT